MTASPSLIDRALDIGVVPGFTSVGYRLRSKAWDATPDLTGREVLVTGASSGLGAATCELLAEAGASVHMLVRDLSKGEDVRSRISELTGSRELRLWRCELSEQGKIREFAEGFTAEVERLDALVNNAGAMPPERTRTSDGIELSFATNVLGPYLLARCLSPSLRAASPGRVVNVSSGGMYGAKLDAGDLQLDQRDYDPVRFYAHTKRCEVILTELCEERLGGRDLTFCSAHPGWADTPGVQNSLPRFSKVMGPLLRDARQGADTFAWLCWARDPLSERGRFWHDREPRPTHKLPSTKETPDARERLWQECNRLAKEDA
ncbi:MAG TPA: SDR family NAD(P)-dependent oxidoreductase [Solirubrobacterales bacterium]|nr:SDR family NAD(P)-dependent oxidoreductase [Solirubrobacterales bacterium]